MVPGYSEWFISHQSFTVNPPAFHRRKTLTVPSRFKAAFKNKQQVRAYLCKALCSSSSVSLIWIFSSDWGKRAALTGCAYLPVDISARLWHFAVLHTHCKRIEWNRSLLASHIRSTWWSGWSDIWYLVKKGLRDLLVYKLYMMHSLKWFFLLAKPCLLYLCKRPNQFASILFFSVRWAQHAFQYDFLEWEVTASC